MTRVGDRFSKVRRDSLRAPLPHRWNTVDGKCTISKLLLAKIFFFSWRVLFPVISRGSVLNGRVYSLIEAHFPDRRYVFLASLAHLSLSLNSPCRYACWMKLWPSRKPSLLLCTKSDLSNDSEGRLNRGRGGGEAVVKVVWPRERVSSSLPSPPAYPSLPFPASSPRDVSHMTARRWISSRRPPRWCVSHT